MKKFLLFFLLFLSYISYGQDVPIRGTPVPATGYDKDIGTRSNPWDSLFVKYYPSLIRVTEAGDLTPVSIADTGWTSEGGGGGGTGTVTSIVKGFGLIADGTITTSGTITVDSTIMLSVARALNDFQPKLNYSLGNMAKQDSANYLMEDYCNAIFKLIADTINAAGYKTNNSIGRQFLSVVKTVNERVFFSDVLQDDDVLQLSIEANSTYILEMLLIVIDSTTTNDSSGINIKLVAPASTTCSGFITADYGISDGLFYDGLGWDLITNESGLDIGFMNGLGITTMLGKSGGGIYRATITTAGTAGTLKLQWTQLIKHIQAVNVLKGSYLKLQKVI
jgi:hypothetical protein